MIHQPACPTVTEHIDRELGVIPSMRLTEFADRVRHDWEEEQREAALFDIYASVDSVRESFQAQISADDAALSELERRYLDGDR